MSDQQTSTIEQLESAPDRVIIAAHYPQFTPGQLFDAFTQADLLTRWWSPAAETDPQLGGRYYIWWEKLGKNLRGSYREFEPGKRLVFSWHWDEEPDMPERVVEIDFLPAHNGTQLTLTHGYYPDTEAGAEERRGYLEGWLYFLPRLDNLSAS
jgi:uncharacterized protein YndB with AHSA1/START domain